MSHTVVVTGVSRDLAARFARSLAAERDLIDERDPRTATGSNASAKPSARRYRVIGVDVAPPLRDLGEAEFVRADIRSPVTAKLLNGLKADVLIHNTAPEVGSGRSATKDYNVLGTMQLAASCQKVSSLRQVVLFSSSAVYGASPRDPVAFSEEQAARDLRGGYGRDCLEAEGYAQLLGDKAAARGSDLAVCVLRPAALIGSGLDTELTRYLMQPVVPRIAGYDARLQFLHPTDASRALSLVLRHRLKGTFNVAAPDVVTLTQLLRQLGRPWVPTTMPVSKAARQAGLRKVAARMGLGSLPTDVAMITYGRVIDTAKFTRSTGFVPQFSTRRAVDEFVAMAGIGPVSVQRFDRAVDQLARVLAPGRSDNA